MGYCSHCEACFFSKSWTIILGLISHGSSANMETVWDQQYLDSRLLVHVKVNSWLQMQN